VQFTFVGGASLDEAKRTQDVYDKFIHGLGIQPKKTDLLLDGGNLVNNNADKVITSRKFLTDNQLNETEGVQVLQDLLEVTNVTILTPDEPTLSHSDGMAALVCPDTIYMHLQPEPNHTIYKNELKKGCPGCTIIEIEGFYDPRIYKGGYASSCGVYVNCVVTDDFIYMPLFNHEKDDDALFKFQNNLCGKKVIPIDVTTVCEMGGSLRCLSWQTQGVWADKIIEYAQNSGSSVLVPVKLIMFFLLSVAVKVTFC